MTTAIEFLSRLRRLGIGVELDGDKVKVRAPAGILTEELRAELRIWRTEITTLLRAAAADPSPESIPLARRDGRLPLSFGQQRLWLLDRLDPGTSEYNVPIVLRLTGPLNLGEISRALDRVTERHEVLRTTITEHDGRPYQVIHPAQPHYLAVTDLSDLRPDLALIEAERIVAAECDRPFDLAEGPLLRAIAVRLGPDDHVLALTMHHLICDEWSARLLHSELTNGCSKPGAAALPPLPIQYADYAVWQRQRMSGQLLADQLSYWREQLSDLPVLRFPTDRPRPPVRDPRGGVVDFTVERDTAAALAQLGHRHRATPFMVLATAFSVLLARYSGMDDITIGTPVAGRAHPATEELIGYFANTLVLRSDLTGNPPFTEALARVRETALDAYTHADLPFERLVERLSPDRDRSRHPLFQVMFNVEEDPGGAQSPIPGTCLSPFGGDLPTRARFDLRMILAVSDGPMRGSIEFRADLFDENTIRRVADHFGVLLNGIAAEPGRQVRQLPLLLPGEHRRLAALPVPAAPASLPEMTGRWASHLPAVSDPARALDYGQLRAEAAAVGAQLRNAGVGPDMVVAIAFPHEASLLGALLGVWCAGAAFLVLDPADPLDRQSYQLRAAGAAVIYAAPGLADLLPATTARVVTPEPRPEHSPAAPPCQPHPSSLAYVVFTSGTTGRPRPVGVTHAGLAHYAAGIVNRLGPHEPGTWLLGQPLSVDLGLTNVAAAFATGGHLRMTEPGRILSSLLADPPDHLKITPTHLRLLLAQPGGAAGLPRKTLILGGEAAPEPLLGALTGSGWGGRLHNHYGPAETTIGVTTAPDDGVRPMPIGQPLPGTACLILDEYGQPVPAGVAGEIHICGPSLARGYLNDPAATAARFVANPFSTAGDRTYRTGDLGRWTADGAVEFLGRLDHQINLRGYRIEPAEVEAALLDHPAVETAAVAVRPDAGGGNVLTAWLVPAVPAGIREWLSTRLPAHLIPSSWVPADSLPLAPNGKLDRRHLPSATAAPQPRLPGDRPDGPTENLLAALWRDLIPADDITRDDNFFDLGGHSLLAAQLITQLDIDLPLTALFDFPTLRELAAHVDELTARTGPR